MIVAECSGAENNNRSVGVWLDAAYRLALSRLAVSNLGQTANEANCVSQKAVGDSSMCSGLEENIPDSSGIFSSQRCDAGVMAEGMTSSSFPDAMLSAARTWRYSGSFTQLGEIMSDSLMQSCPSILERNPARRAGIPTSDTCGSSLASFRSAKRSASPCTTRGGTLTADASKISRSSQISNRSASGPIGRDDGLAVHFNRVAASPRQGFVGRAVGKNPDGQVACVGCNAGGRCIPLGTMASTATPRSVDATVMVPPNACTRSRIPIMPKPCL